MGSLVLFELRKRWKAALGWGVGLTLFGALYLVIFPEVEQEMAGLADISIYQVMGVNLGSFPDYIGSVVLLFVPLLLGIYAISNGTRTLAGEEEDGTLELVMARPLDRRQIVIAKAFAIGVTLFVVLLVAGGGNAAILSVVKRGYDTPLMPGQLFLALLSSWPITFAVAMIALFLGALTPTRRLATAAVTTFFVGSYFGENLSGMVSSLEGLKPFMIFSHYDSSATALTEGPALGDIGVLLALCALFLGLALWVFGRRNVTVGEWTGRSNPGPR
ncbi:MAG: ABC transporter permease subunit [Spirochaetota bacterium]